jgi:hypothetical protein
MSTTLPNLEDLVQLLRDATDRKAVHWTQTADEETFRAELPFGLVRVAKWAGPHSSFSLFLVDHDGTLLREYQPSGEGETILLEGLYNKARGQALNLDRKLKDFYDHLKALVGKT